MTPMSTFLTSMFSVDAENVVIWGFRITYKAANTSQSWAPVTANYLWKALTASKCIKMNRLTT